MLTTNGLLPSIQPVSEIAISSVFPLYCAYRHKKKCVRMRKGNTSANSEMTKYSLEDKTEKDYRERHPPYWG